MSLGIYLHIPFCKQKCLYCDFNSFAGQEAWFATYQQAMMAEIAGFSYDGLVDSIYFGGGTPTVLGPERLSALLEQLKSRFSLSADCEITVECNPGTINKRGLQELVQTGFKRLSIGLQSCDDGMLRRLGRIHTFADFKRCVQDARAVGFENLSLDLMYGLPEQAMENWKDTLEKVLDFQPEHLSCYGLKIEEGTPFARMDLTLPDDDAVRMMYDVAVERLAKAGYARYEISNFAKPGKESRHNCKYWQCDDFVGFGAGAYSCIDHQRYYNVSGIADYCSKIAKTGTAVEECVTLSKQDRMSEFCFLGLRMAQGIDGAVFRLRFEQELREIFGEALEKNLLRGTLEYRHGRYRIPSEFLYVSNGILTDFV